MGQKIPQIETKCGPLSIEIKKGKEVHYMVITQTNPFLEDTGKIMLDLDDIYKFKEIFNKAYNFLYVNAGERKVTFEEMQNAIDILNRK